MRDVVFEAAFLREAVLVGLRHEREVIEWATDLLDSDAGPVDAVVELLSVPVQLSPVREALRAFGPVHRASSVSDALIASVALDPTQHQRGVEHLLRLLSDIRRLVGCPTGLARAIADFAAREMWQADDDDRVTTAELLAWLRSVRQPAHFLVAHKDRDAADRFAVALTAAAQGAGTMAAPRADVAGWTLALDEAMWTVACERFGPLPVASTVPYPGRPPRETGTATATSAGDGP